MCTVTHFGFCKYFFSTIYLAVAVAQCLLVITEDNPVAWRVLIHFAKDIVSLITNIERNEQNILLRTVAAAVLSNVPSLSTAYINQIFDTLDLALGVNHRELLGKWTSSVPLGETCESLDGFEVAAEEQMNEETEEDASKRRRKQDLPTEYDIQTKIVGWILEAQRIAAETITNLCSSDENGNLS